MRPAFEHKLSEVDRLLNDPDAALDPARIWFLVAEIARHETAAAECNANDDGLS